MAANTGGESQQGGLRRGFTTGACAAAAARGAVRALVSGERSLSPVSVWLPAGFSATFALHSCELIKESSGEILWRAAVIKDGGDDPDVTHGAEIGATAGWADLPYGDVKIEGGKGVGRVSLPGLPVEPGEAAINPVPRKMITDEVLGVLREFLKENPTAGREQQGVKVVIDVPEGEKLALQTMNPRLGILNGISILGTRGVVIPFSTAAYRSSLVTAVRLASKNGATHLVFSTGGRSENAGRRLYPALSESAFIEAGEFVGYSFRLAKRFGVKKGSLVAMIGKLSKVAAGVMMVHSKKSSIDFGFLSHVAEIAGAGSGLVEKIRGANTAAQVAGWIKEEGPERFFGAIAEMAARELYAVVDRGLEIEVVLIDSDGELLGRSEIAG